MSSISTNDLQKLFKSLDKDNSGRISISELHALLHRIGIETTLEDLQTLVPRTDLDYADFLSLYEAIANENDEDLWQAFKVFDVDDDGFISCEELKMALTKMGFMEKKSREDVRDMIHVYDKNSDGVIDFDEFKDMMSSGGV
ncbi:probable calcium-binding protein CML44 [Salvia hispanica]|uniref:probable calcium-binding protein CML44 n=1 Tax=Salvia hispanica TaxID=49212 RepID=UPI002009DA21|nr:probable calcium-binding protein CML44 [Salvia hispanica]